VVDLIQAETEEAAKAALLKRLRAAGFEVVETTGDAFESEDLPDYEKCATCHLFVVLNDVEGPNIAEYVHLHRGDTADEALDETHEATPSGQIHSLDYWRQHGPAAMRERFSTMTSEEKS